MIVARAWTDAGFRQRLLADAKAAIRELGLDFPGPALTALENAPALHHVVVCTLCSCYPRQILGRSPSWYKSRAYRARVVRDPCGVLAEFGTHLPEGTRVPVMDSTADHRYLVPPLRPAGTESLSEEDLKELITRDSMIGVAPAKAASSGGPIASDH